MDIIKRGVLSVVVIFGIFIVGLVVNAQERERISPQTTEPQVGAQGALAKIMSELLSVNPAIIFFPVQPSITPSDFFYWKTENAWIISVSDGLRLYGTIWVDTTENKFEDNYKYAPVEQTIFRIEEALSRMGFVLNTRNSEEFAKYDRAKNAFIPTGHYSIKAFKGDDALCLLNVDLSSRKEITSGDMQRNPGNEEVYFGVSCVTISDFNQAKNNQMPYLKALGWKDYTINDKKIIVYPKRASGYTFIGKEPMAILWQDGGQLKKIFELEEMTPNANVVPCDLLKKHTALKKVIKDCKKNKKIAVKPYFSKKLGVSFSYPTNLSFFEEKTATPFKDNSYILEFAKKTYLLIGVEGHTQDMSGMILVFNKPLADVLKNYQGLPQNTSLVSVVQGKNTWKKYGGYYYLEQKGRTYMFGTSDNIPKKDLIMMLRTFRVK